MNTIAAVLLAVLAATRARARRRSPPPTSISSRRRSPTQGGRPSGPGVVSRVWYGGQRMRMEAGGVESAPALILRLDQGKAYRSTPRSDASPSWTRSGCATRGQMDSAMAGELMGADERPRGHHRPCPASARSRAIGAAASASAAARW